MNSTAEISDGNLEPFFTWLDFTLFILMLSISTLIGIYFGFCGKKDNTPKEYLHGGKTMSTLPIAVSLVSSTLSGITVMGVPTEIYIYGTTYCLAFVTAFLMCVINNYAFLPVFYGLQLTSTYEYLELRFNHRVRVMASVLYAITLLLYIPIVVYVPALVLSQVSGVNLHYITVCTSILCIFYTMLGGLKAVVWTDFLQGIVMVAAGIAVIILGLLHVGGFAKVWQRNIDGGRIHAIEMTFSPFERMTFWTLMIGNTFSWMFGVCVNQSMVQKFMALPTYSSAQKSLAFFCVGIIVIIGISCFTGLLIYATYYDCDPLTTQVITKPDQLTTYFVMDIAASVPGLPGLFVAGIFSAALSTMSSSLNALGATLFEDFVRPCIKSTISDAAINKIIKCVVVIIGSICLFTVFLVDKMGSILQLSLSVGGVPAGAMLGLFSFGMFYPRGNAKGALAGSICSLLIMGWIVFGTQKALADGSLRHPTLPASVEGCDFNVTLPIQPAEEEVFILYRLSFMYYTPLGTAILFVVGIIVSLLTEPPKPEKMNPALFAPFMRKFVTQKKINTNLKENTEKKLLHNFT